MTQAAGRQAWPWVGPVVSAVAILAVLTLGGRTLVAARTWQSVYARLTSDVVSAPRAATVWSALAWEESKRGNHARAMELVERSLQIYPNSPAAHGVLGDILLRRREPAAAVLQFDRALELAPQHWTLRMNRGRALMEAGRLEEAERELREVVRVAPIEFEAHLFLGGVLLRTGRPSEALQHLQLAARLEPKAATPFAGLALAALQLGDQAAAARYGRGAERRGQPMPDSFWSAVGGRREERPGAPPPGGGL
jgi:Flp pilus assembly protein TadD